MAEMESTNPEPDGVNQGRREGAGGGGGGGVDDDDDDDDDDKDGRAIAPGTTQHQTTACMMSGKES